MVQGGAAPARDAWGAIARTYRWQEPLERRSLRTLLGLLAPQDDELVVDVGSGVGHVPRLLARSRTVRTVAVEPSPRMLASGRYAGASRLRGDAVALPLAGASVDVVVAGWLLHVLDAGGRAAAVQEIARVLRPGGRLGVVVPAVPTGGPARLQRGAATAMARAAGLPAFRVPADLPGLLTDAGLQVRHHSRTSRGYLADVVVCTRVRAVLA